MSRLKAQWADQPAQWNRRDLSSARWVYWWADGIHIGAGSDDSDGQRLLAIIGVTPEGEKGHVAISDGYRESKESWCERLLYLKQRGLPGWPVARVRRRRHGLWVGDGGRAPADEASALLVSQDWNGLNALPKPQQGPREEGAASHLDGGHARRRAGRVQ